MVPSEKPIEMNDLPEMRADKKPDVSASKPQKSEKSTSEKNKTPVVQTAVWPAIAVLILFLVGVSIWNNVLTNQLQEQKKQTQMALERLGDLESRLASTDENMSQSSVSMQVRLNELKQRTDDLWSQMDKLWASAWRRNQKELSDQSKALAEVKASDKAQGKKFSNLQTDLAALQIRLEEIDALSQQLTDQSQRLSQNKQSIVQTQQTTQKVEATMKKLQQRIKENEEWVGSNVAFRKQVNKKLSSLEKKLRELNQPIVNSQ
jgi:chromosome segregation ATPase